jgi:hypothetical protein
VVRTILAGALMALSWSCREVLPLEISSPITGYQLDGTVTTSNGVPVSGVEVVLYYEKDLTGTQPTDTASVVVRDPTKPVDVAVYTEKLQFVRQLFLGYKPAGVLPPMLWNGTDKNGAPVPSGKYVIRYVVDTAIVKFSPVLVEGHTTTVTDQLGHFTLNADRLPIGETFDLYSSTNAYVGTYQVVPSVDIILRTASSRMAYLTIDLLLNQVTSKVFILP